MIAPLDDETLQAFGALRHQRQLARYKAAVWILVLIVAVLLCLVASSPPDFSNSNDPDPGFMPP